MFVELLIFVVTLLFVLHAFHMYSTRGMPPGPYGVPILGYIPFMGSEPHVVLSDLAKKYGNVYSITLGTKRMVVANDYKSIRNICKLDVFTERGDVTWYKRWGCAGTKDGLHGVICNEGPDWQEQRRFLLRNLRDLGFGTQSMDQLIVHEAQELTNGLLKDTGKSINLEQRLELAVVNSLWQLSSGHRFEHNDVHLIDVVDRMTKYVAEANMTSALGLYFPILERLFPKLLKIHEMEKIIDEIRDLMKKSADKHKETFKEESMRDLTDVYLKEIKSTSDTTSSFAGEKGERNLHTILMDLFGAGIETTTSALVWMCLYLIRFPEVQKKIQEEIDNIIGHDRPPSITDRSRMPYTEATVLESLRFSSFVPLSLLHKAEEDVEFGGWMIPKGTNVILNSYHAMHDPNHWDNPHDFKPERFITSDGKLRNDEAMLIFGTGKRVCVGEGLARNQMFVFITSILQRLSVQSEPGVVPTMKVRNQGVTIHPVPYKAVLTKRTNM